MISFKHKFIFIHIPKSAGTSIENALQYYSDDEIHNGLIKPGRMITEIARKKKVKLDNYRHLSYDKYKQILGNDINNFFIFSVLRKPYDRIPSLYYQSRIKDISLAKFVGSIRNSRHIVSSEGIKMAMIKTFIGNVKDIFLLKFDNLNEDWKVLLNKLNLPYIKLEHLNRDKIKSYKHLYKDLRFSQLMKEVFKDEISEYFTEKKQEKIVKKPVKEKEYEYFFIDIIGDISAKIERELHIDWKF